MLRPVVCLLRHGSTESSLERRLLGSVDEPLSESGCEQARLVAREVWDWAQQEGYGRDEVRVVASELRRAKETAFIVSEKLGCPLTLVRALNERDFGSLWSGRTLVELGHLFPEAAVRFMSDPLSFDPPHSETSRNLRRRVKQALQALNLSGFGGLTILITHDGPIRALLQELGLAEFAMVPIYGIRACGSFWLELKQSGWCLVRRDI